MVSIRYRVITFVTSLRFNQAKSMKNEWMKGQDHCCLAYRDKGKKTIRKVERNRRAALRNFDFVRSGDTNVRPVHYLIRHFGNYRPNVPGQLSARKVGKRKQENRRAYERDSKRKGAHIGDKGKAKKVQKMTRNQLCVVLDMQMRRIKSPLAPFLAFVGKINICIKLRSA